METVNPFGQAQPCVSEETATLFVSLELSRAMASEIAVTR